MGISQKGSDYRALYDKKQGLVAEGADYLYEIRQKQR